MYDNDRSHIKAIDSVGDPPLPIPNREVKPDSADGTANVCGRVGHRHFYFGSSGRKSGASFFAVNPPLRHWAAGTANVMKK